MVLAVRIFSELGMEPEIDRQGNGFLEMHGSEEIHVSAAGIEQSIATVIFGSGRTGIYEHQSSPKIG
jgi:hypothetical protein